MASLKLPTTLLAILTLAAFFAGPLGELIGPLEYVGSLSYTYVEGDNPIVKVVFQFDDEIGKQLIVTNAPPQWSWMHGGNILSMSGGSMQPGDTLVVQISFREFVPPGEKPFTAVGTTSAGEESTANGILSVSLMVLLQVLSILALNRFYLLAATILMGLLGVLLGGKPKVELPASPGPVMVDPDDVDVRPPPIIHKDTVDKKCQCTHNWIHQYMDLDIEPRGTIRTLSDDPLPLKGTATDKHALIHTCTCPATGVDSTQAYIIEANVKIEWEIIRGGGGFININDEAGQNKVTGQQVLYQPQDIENTEDEIIVQLKVTAHHDDGTKEPEHDPVEIIVDMKIKREVTEDGDSTESDTEFTDPGNMKDEYVYSIEIRGEPVQGDDLPEEVQYDCHTEKYWDAGTEITGSITKIPGEIAYGDFVRFEAEGSDTDNLEISCAPTEWGCEDPSETSILPLSDCLEFVWTAEKGSFPIGNVGREVIWQAPDEEGEVRIKLVIRDVGTQFVDETKEDIKIVNVHKLGLDLMKTPAYWLPDAANGALEVPAITYLCRNGKWVQPGRKKFIRAKLYKVSREPGICMNFPGWTMLNPDLFFDEARTSGDYLLYRDKTVVRGCPEEIVIPNDNPKHDHHHLYTILRKRKVEAKFGVRSEDYGAVGYLVAEANHCVPIPPIDSFELQSACNEGPNDIKIPRDDNDNDIADGCRQDMNGASASDDKDSMPAGDGYDGDGLTNYEEYRGFIIGGRRPLHRMRHIRTDPRRKDLFIYKEFPSTPTALVVLTDLRYHKLYDPRLFNGVDSRVINFNHGRHHGGEQHGLWLSRDNTMEYLGYAHGGPSIPKDMTHIDVNHTKLSGDFLNYLSTVAHEICHGINIWHHGRGTTHECEYNDHDINVESRGGIDSGELECVMTYQNALGWCHGDDHHVHLNAILNFGGDEVQVRRYLYPNQTVLCDSNAATGLNNVGGHTNPATRGNCKGQIRVKDW